jgi:hypothetical protein
MAGIGQLEGQIPCGCPGADVNARALDGKTPLLHAVGRRVVFGEALKVQSLLRLPEVDLGATDAAGRTAVDLTQDCPGTRFSSVVDVFIAEVLTLEVRLQKLPLVQLSIYGVGVCVTCFSLSIILVCACVWCASGVASVCPWSLTACGTTLPPPSHTQGLYRARWTPLRRAWIGVVALIGARLK